MNDAPPPTKIFSAGWEQYCAHPSCQGWDAFGSPGPAATPSIKRVLLHRLTWKFAPLRRGSSSQTASLGSILYGGVAAPFTLPSV